MARRARVRDLRDFVTYPFARLLKGFEIGAEVVRSRVQGANDLPAANKNEFDVRSTGHRVGVFETVVGAQDPCAPARQPTKPHDSVSRK
jgi:hypothetical protein